MGHNRVVNKRTNKKIIIMTKTTTVASKAFVAIVAAAMVFALVAPAAKAATAEELQAQITALMAQIAALTPGTAPVLTTGGNCAAIPAPLTMNASGASVTALQNYLISNGQSIPAGATGFFGAQTRSAVAAWQTANGVMPAVGYYGPVTAAAMAAKCVPVDPGTGTPTTPTTPGGTTTLKGEASLDRFEIDDADDTDVQEGDEEVEIGMITVEFTDGDAEISRLDIALTDSEGTNSDAWDTFDSVQLMVDGDVIAEVDASSKDDYLGDEDLGIIRFSDLKLIAMEDEEMEITVSATFQDNLDTENLGEWTLAAEAFRFFDADGVATTEDGAPVDVDTATFNIEMAGMNEELKFSLASGNPDSTDIVVDETSSTNDVTILEYTIEAKDGDIELTTLAVMLETSDIINDVVGDIQIDIDGETFNDDSFVGSKANATTTFLFDIDGDVTIDEGDEVTVKVMVDFKRQDTNYSNGSTIKASVVRSLTEAEGADDLEDVDGQFTGSAVGDMHTLVASGILVPVDGVTTSANTTGDNDQTGEFKIEFEVTGVEDDYYITELVGESVSNGIQFLVEVASGTTTASGVLSSTADEETPGVFTVRDGETETFTLTVTVDTSATAQARVTLTEVNYSANVNGVTGAQAYLPTPSSDFRTSYKNINAN
jgi:peptidoglycan hydrolase-like protein with peptidoglycan-binding domain